MRALSFAAVLGLVALTACAHGRSDSQVSLSDEPSADARVNQRIGRDILEVIRAWGPPTISLREQVVLGPVLKLGQNGLDSKSGA